VEDKKDLDGPMPNDVPRSGGSEEERDEFLRRCRDERDELSGKQTADCAGADVAEEYEDEEDGGS
jgi:hypothetical protein